MNDFTVVTYFTPDFQCFESGLREDCERLGYAFHAHALSAQFENVIRAFDYKISFIREMVERYDHVLWLDVECRILKSLPENWSSPLISTYRSGRSQGFSSGVLMLDRSQIGLIELWLKYARKYPDYPDDFVLDFLSTVVSVEFETISLEFYDRKSTSPIARGLWKNEQTIIQHPSINRWPEPMKYRAAFNGQEQKNRTAEESISRQRKALFYRNFPGDFQTVDQVMQSGMEHEYHDSDWVFDAVRQLYAPRMYWPDLSDDYTAKPRSFETSWENFNKKPKGQSFRDLAIRNMRLDPEDQRKYRRPRTGIRDKLFRRVYDFLTRRT